MIPIDLFTSIPGPTFLWMFAARDMPPVMRATRCVRMSS
jgi:hypothetical protein